MFSAILAIIKAIPSIKSLVDSFVSYYVGQQIAAMKKENKDAIRKALNEHDQIDLEKALGNPSAGEVSNNPGTSIIDAPPIGVHK